MNYRVSVILLASLLAAGCASRSTPTTAPADVGGTYAAPAAGTGPLRIEGVDYDYIATPSREQQILEGFPNLRVGQSRAEVRAAIGAPDRAAARYGKEYPGRFVGWAYLYKIRMREGGPNMNDVSVEVFFDPMQNRLTTAVPNGIDGLQKMGGVAH